MSELLVKFKVPNSCVGHKPRADGRYPGRVKMPDGKTYYFYGKSRQEVAQKIIDFLPNYKSITAQKPERITLKDWVKTFLETYKQGNISGNTYKNYCMSQKSIYITALSQNSNCAVLTICKYNNY